MLGLAGCSSTSVSAPPSSTTAVAPPTASTVQAAPSSSAPSVDGAPTAAPDLASQFREILGTDFNGSALVSRDGDREIQPRGACPTSFGPCSWRQDTPSLIQIV